MIYRDTLTGRFAAKSTWKRSKAQGGDRYKRERPKKKEEPERGPVLPPKEQLREWLVTFTYKTRVKSLDVICSAYNEDEAEAKAVAHIRGNRKARRVFEAMDKFKISAKQGRKLSEHIPTVFRSNSKRED